MITKGTVSRAGGRTAVRRKKAGIDGNCCKKKCDERARRKAKRGERKTDAKGFQGGDESYGEDMQRILRLNNPYNVRG